MTSTNVKEHELMCNSCASFRNKAEKFFNAIGCLFMVICSIVFYKIMNGSGIGGVLASMFAGAMAGSLLMIVLRFFFYIFDEIRMFFVRRHSK